MAKEKIPGAMHAGVAASRARTRPFAVAIVYAKDTGAPRLDPEFVKNLTAQQRAVVVEDLRAHGYDLNESDVAVKLNGGV